MILRLQVAALAIQSGFEATRANNLAGREHVLVDRRYAKLCLARDIVALGFVDEQLKLRTAFIGDPVALHIVERPLNLSRNALVGNRASAKMLVRATVPKDPELARLQLFLSLGRATRSFRANMKYMPCRLGSGFLMRLRPRVV